VRSARRPRRHIFIDIRPRLRYHPHRIPLGKDIGRRHRPMERERFPRARARHLRSRAASEQRPAGTMTGLRGARWTGTGNSASQEARPELSCGVGSLQQAPRWNADRRRVAWILCAQTCVHLSAWTRAAPPPLSSPARGGGQRRGRGGWRYASAGVPPPFPFVARMNEVKSGVGVASRAIVPGFRCASPGVQMLIRATDRTLLHVIMATPVPPPA
jgi:hypothetical protein